MYFRQLQRTIKDGGTGCADVPSRMRVSSRRQHWPEQAWAPAETADTAKLSLLSAETAVFRTTSVDLFGFGPDATKATAIIAVVDNGSAPCAVTATCS